MKEIICKYYHHLKAFIKIHGLLVFTSVTLFNASRHVIKTKNIEEKAVLIKKFNNLYLLNTVIICVFFICDC